MQDLAYLVDLALGVFFCVLDIEILESDFSFIGNLGLPLLTLILIVRHVR